MSQEVRENIFAPFFYHQGSGQGNRAGIVHRIHLVEDHPGDIHLFITGVVMQGMNGREPAERLGAIRPHLERKYMSGYTAYLIAHRGILDEEVNFITKPFGSDDFAARVRQVFDR